MKIAWTIDDLAVWPHYPLPEGFTPTSVAMKLISAFDRNGMSEIFALANSWSLEVYPEAAEVLDRWLEAGHHIGNHTHAHKLLSETPADKFIIDIDKGTIGLAPWMKTAPRKAFRYPLGLWGDTDEKRTTVMERIRAENYEIADITCQLFEWHWDRAWQVLRNEGSKEEANNLENEFIEFSVAQLAHDRETCQQVFGRDVVGIGLAHNLAFFCEVADRLFTRLRAEGVEFVPLDDALNDPCYGSVGSLVTADFQTFPQKIAAARGSPVPSIAPAYSGTIRKVLDIAGRGAVFRRRSLVPENA